jgi:hypothetical protein
MPTYQASEFNEKDIHGESSFVIPNPGDQIIFFTKIVAEAEPNANKPGAYRHRLEYCSLENFGTALCFLPCESNGELIPGSEPQGWCSQILFDSIIDAIELEVDKGQEVNLLSILHTPFMAYLKASTCGKYVNIQVGKIQCCTEDEKDDASRKILEYAQKNGLTF